MPDTIALARDSGHAAAKRCADKAGEAFRAAAFEHFKAFAEQGKTFTTEDARDAYRGPAPHDARAWGYVAQRASRAGIVKCAGFAPARSSNGSPTTLWAAC
jgi:hypothetical protein